MTTTDLRFRKANAYGISAGAPNYLAFTQNASVICSEYHDGTYLGDVAETTSLTLDLYSDAAVLAASRYLILWSTTRLEVWDTTANTVAGFDVETGWVIAGAGAYGGTVYWIEMSEGPDWTAGGPGWQTSARLRSSGYDLSAPATVSTLTIEDSFHWEWHDTPTWFAVTPLAALAERRADDVVNAEVWTHFRVRMPFSGSGNAYDDGAESSFSAGIAEANGGAFGIGNGGSGIGLRRLPDSETDAVVDHFPTSGDWELAAAAAVSVSTGGDVAVYGDTGAAMVLLRDAISGTYGASPATRFAVGDHPVEGPPARFYIKG